MGTLMLRRLIWWVTTEEDCDFAQMLGARVADGDPKLVEIVEQAIAQAEDARSRAKARRGRLGISAAQSAFSKHGHSAHEK
jgi:hypothetical protein